MQLYMIQLLASPDQTLRSRALREVEAVAPTMTPLTLFLVAAQLSRSGDAEAAALWRYFAELRMRTDMLSGVVQPPEFGVAGANFFELMIDQMTSELRRTETRLSQQRRTALLAQALRMEERVQRSYSPNWALFGLATPDATPTPWPARSVMTRARREARAMVETRLRESFEREALQAAYAGEIAGGRLPAEAGAIIPQPFRARIVPTHAIELNRECDAVSTLLAGPARANRPLFIVACEQSDERTLYTWIDALDGRTIAKTERPQGVGRGANSAFRAGEALLAFDAPGGEIVLMSTDGRITQLTPPPSGVSGSFTGITASGRYALYGSAGSQGVLDLETNTWMWTPLPASPANTDRTSFRFVEEDATGPFAVGVRQGNCQPGGACRTSEIIRRELVSGRERAMAIEDVLWLEQRSNREALALLRRPPEPRRDAGVRAYANEEEWRAARPAQSSDRLPNAATQPVAVIDLVEMRVAWTGARGELPVADGVRCSATRNAMFPSTALPRGIAGAEISLDGANAALEPSPRASADVCVLLSDGSRMAVAAAPFLYLYEIRAQ
jgi:hypothetical protein